MNRKSRNNKNRIIAGVIAILLCVAMVVPMVLSAIVR